MHIFISKIVVYSFVFIFVCISSGRRLMKLYDNKSFPIKGLYMHSVVVYFSFFVHLQENTAEVHILSTHLILIFLTHGKIFAHIYNNFWIALNKVLHGQYNYPELYLKRNIYLRHFNSKKINLYVFNSSSNTGFTTICPFADQV